MAHRHDDTIPCPHCGEAIYDDAERCPHCENYISEEEDTQPSRKPWWIIVCTLLCLYAVYRWITRG
jgi:predicted nucleic acid-binding Zn ribbon protein